MMKSPICSLLSKTSWIITALVSINLGLGLFGINVLAMPFLLDNALLLTILFAVIGLSGVWSLIHFFVNPTSCQ